MSRLVNKCVLQAEHRYVDVGLWASWSAVAAVIGSPFTFETPMGREALSLPSESKDLAWLITESTSSLLSLPLLRMNPVFETRSKCD